MNVVLIAVYAVASGLLLLAGAVYPQVKEWSYWAAATCVLHLLVSLLLGLVKIATAARLASWCCQGISTVLCVALLLAYAHSQEGGWILAIAAVIGLNFITTLVLALALVPDSAPRAGKGFYDGGNPKH
jgi:uncharacterized membrane protein HdeD (DUF308 family)